MPHELHQLTQESHAALTISLDQLESVTPSAQFILKGEIDYLRKSLSKQFEDKGKPQRLIDDLTELAKSKGLEFQQPTLEIEQYNFPQREVLKPTFGINPSEHSTRISSAYANGMKIDLDRIKEPPINPNKDGNDDDDNGGGPPNPPTSPRDFFGGGGNPPGSSSMKNRIESVGKITCEHEKLQSDNQALTAEINTVTRLKGEGRSYQGSIRLKYDYKNPSKYNIPLCMAMTPAGKGVSKNIFAENQQLLKVYENMTIAINY
jgi:hypothetical protein